MNGTKRALAVVLVGAGIFTLGAAPAMCGDEFCPMGGTLIKVGVDKDKAIAWVKERRKSAVTDEDKDEWSALTLSTTDKDIAILIKKDSVFFGAAGKGGREVDSREADRTFGNSLRKLRDAVKKEMGEMRQARVVDIDGSDVQPLSDAAGLGVLEKKGRDWGLTTEDCKGVDIDASGLK
jgi:hypothetical protein